MSSDLAQGHVSEPNLNCFPTSGDYTETCDLQGIYYVRTQGNSRVRKMRIRLESALAARDGLACFYCDDDLREGKRANRQIDHVMPARRGGGDSIENLVWACRRCNLLKGDTPGWFFVLWLAA